MASFETASSKNAVSCQHYAVRFEFIPYLSVFKTTHLIDEKFDSSFLYDKIFEYGQNSWILTAVKSLKWRNVFIFCLPCPFRNDSQVLKCM